MRIEVDRTLCQSHGECAATAPEVFQLDENDELQYDAEPGEEQREACEAAANVCPMQAITVSG